MARDRLEARGVLGYREERASFAALLAAARKPGFCLGPSPGLEWEPGSPKPYSHPLLSPGRPARRQPPSASSHAPYPSPGTLRLLVYLISARALPENGYDWLEVSEPPMRLADNSQRVVLGCCSALQGGSKCLRKEVGTEARKNTMELVRCPEHGEGPGSQGLLGSAHLSRHNCGPPSLRRDLLLSEDRRPRGPE